MKFGFDDNKFYVEVNGCSREVRSLKEEVKIEARRLHALDSNLLLALSAGLDSQVILHSFLSQGIGIESVFFHMPGFNDNEYENVRAVQKKFGNRVTVYTEDATKIRKAVDQLSVELDINPAHAIHAYFCSKLPEGRNVVQGLAQPNFCVKDGKPYILHSYFDPDIGRKRAVEGTGRLSYNFLFTNEVMLSYLTDPFFSSMVRSWNYLDNNGLQRKGTKVKSLWACEVYVKPLQYAHLWKDHLLYFPKYAGSEKLTFWHKLYAKDNIVLIPLDEYCNLLKVNNTLSQRVYQLDGPQHNTEYFN